MGGRPAFIDIPTPEGPPISAVVAARSAVTEVMINNRRFLGLLLSVNKASATIGVMSRSEAAKLRDDLTREINGLPIRKADESADLMEARRIGAEYVLSCNPGQDWANATAKRILDGEKDDAISVRVALDGIRCGRRLETDG